MNEEGFVLETTRHLARIAVCASLLFASAGCGADEEGEATPDESNETGSTSPSDTTPGGNEVQTVPVPFGAEQASDMQICGGVKITDPTGHEIIIKGPARHSDMNTGGALLFVEVAQILTFVEGTGAAQLTFAGQFPGLSTVVGANPTAFPVIMGATFPGDARPAGEASTDPTMDITTEFTPPEAMEGESMVAEARFSALDDNQGILIEATGLIERSVDDSNGDTLSTDVGMYAMTFVAAPKMLGTIDACP